jgi:hypothetical protein
MKLRISRNVAILVLTAILVFMPAWSSVSQNGYVSGSQQASVQGIALSHKNIAGLSGPYSSSQNITTVKSNLVPQDRAKLTNFVSVKNFKESATNLSVNPQSLYNSEPAPMGIADYGLSTQCLFGYNSYSYSTPSFLGKVNITSLSTDNSTNKSVGKNLSFQMNVNLEFYDAGNEYDYWIQDVAVVNTGTPRSICFIDNVWNFSSRSAEMHDSTISGNGTVAKSGSTMFYYAVANAALPGNGINIAFPKEFQMKVLSEINSNGNPEVVYQYNDGYGWITYDNPSFIFANNVTSDLGFTVNGSTYNPIGTYYDAELIMGGPGGGSDTKDISSNLSMKLQYWNGHNYQMISNAFNHGSDTAEGIYNVSSVARYFTHSGSIFAEETPGSGTLGQIYNYSDIGVLNLSTTFKNGILSVGGDMHDFQDYNINLTLGTGNYSLILYNSTNPGAPVWISSVNISAGSYKQLDASGFYAVTFSENGLPPGAGWFINITGRSSSGKISGSVYTIYLPNGTYYYNISTTLKIYRPSYNGSLKVAGEEATQNVQFRQIKYSIIFNETGLGTGIVWYVNSTTGISSSSSGNSINFEVTNGTYLFSVSSRSSYYEMQSEYNLTVSGSNLTETVVFIHYSYIYGKISPSNATLEINGKTVNVTGGSFNISVRNGTYYISASLNGYSTYAKNITISSGQQMYLNITLNVSVNPQEVTHKTSASDIYYMGGLVAVIAIFGLAGLLARRRK